MHRKINYLKFSSQRHNAIVETGCNYLEKFTSGNLKLPNAMTISFKKKKAS